jgi:hypothetical protein
MEHRSHPCKKRKDGAPSSGYGNRETGAGRMRHPPGTGAMTGMGWGAVTGCVLTWEIGCAEGAVTLGTVGFVSGAAKSLYDSAGQTVGASRQKQLDLNACAAIP